MFLVSTGLHSSEAKPVKESVFTKTLHSKVLKTIQCSHEIPGLKAEEFSKLKPEISKTWDSLVKNSVLELRGKDKDIRPLFVTLQAVIEHVLSTELRKDVKKLTGFIHTPMPATPLCNLGTISKALVASSIAVDPLRLFTVQARTTIIRDYLFQGGDLYIVYPKEGFNKRTEKQQQSYKQELANYPTHLFDVPLDCDTIPPHLIGATYLFENAKGKTFMFSIRGTQANDPKDETNFGLWFGPVEHPFIKARIQEISSYLKENGSNILPTNF